MVNHGKISSNGFGIRGAMQATSGVNDWKALSISGESGAHVVDGYLIVSTWMPYHILIGIHNSSTTTDATVIAKTKESDTEATITIPATGTFLPLPPIGKIKVTGTSDGIVCLFVKKG